MATTPATRKPAQRGRSPGYRGRRNRRSQDQILRSLLFVLPIALIVGVILASSIGGERSNVQGHLATDFTLPDTAGGTFTLTDALAKGDTVLYFSMGVGCDGCFAQIPEIVEALHHRGISLTSLMVDPAEAVATQAQRFEVTDPIVIDADRTVSEAFGMLGVYGHNDRPSHSFALVRADGEVAAVRHYATMFVPASQLLRDLGIS